MRKHSKLILAGLTASLLMAIAISGTATAQTFSLNNMNFRVVWRTLEFKNETGLGTIRCPVTLEGSFHSQTISKVEKALIGQVSRGTVGSASCTSGPATIDQESLPWHITYNGFRGILPRINSIRLLLSGPRFQLREPFGATCQASADTAHEARGEAFLNASGEVTTIRPDRTPNIPLTGCAASNGRFEAPEGDGIVTLLGTTTRIRVTLI